MERSAEWAAGAAKRMELESVVANLVSQMGLSSTSSSSSTSPSAPTPSTSLPSSSSSERAAATTSSWLGEGGANPSLQKDALKDAVAVAADAARQPADKEAFVLSSTGVWHLVVRGPPSFCIADWITSCGWSFGGSRAAKLGELHDLPDDPLLLCARCLPALRRAAKGNIARTLKDQ